MKIIDCCKENQWNLYSKQSSLKEIVAYYYEQKQKRINNNCIVDKNNETACLRSNKP